MRKLTKFLSCTLSAGALIAAAAGCGEYKRPDSGTTNLADYTVNFNLPATTEADIKVIIPDNEPERKLMNALIGGFNEKYPKITVTMNFLTIDSYNSTVTKQAEAGVLADIVWTNSSNYYYLISNDIALNLDVFTKQAEAAGEFVYESDFTPDAKSMGMFDGVRYAVPRSTDSVVTFYNKEILTAAGVDLDPATTKVKNGWSWDDFLSVCARVRAYYDGRGDTEFYPIDANLGWEAVSWPIIESLGGEVINEKGEFALTKEKADEVYDFVQNLVSNKYVPSGNSSKSSFESGTGAMLFQSTSIDNYADRATLRGKFDVVSFPKISGEDSSIGIGFAGYALNKALLKDQTKLDASAAFMAYLMSREGQQTAAGEGGLTLPSIRADLGVDNASANWHTAYRNYNMSAYTYGSEYKITQDFLAYKNPVFSNGILTAMNTFVGSYSIRETADRAYNLFKGEMEDAFNSIVS